MASLTQRVIGRMAAILFFGSGIAAILLPSPASTNRIVQVATGLLAVMIGVFAWYAPWERWPLKATLALVPFALALLGSSVLLGNYNRSTYALYYLIVFVWIGVSHRRGTSLAFAPLAAAVYVFPLMATGRATDALTSVWEVIVLGMLVGEGLSWMSARLRRAEALDSSRMWEMQSLLQAAERLAREHDPRHTPQLVATLGQQLLRADGTAVFLMQEHGRLAPVATSLWSVPLEGTTLDVAESQALQAVLRSESGAVLDPSDLPASFTGTGAYGSILLLPLRGSASVQGLFACGYPSPGFRLEAFDEHASRTFATQAALALERVQVEESLLEDSLQDELTALGNRRYANRVLARLQPGDAVAMIDLDHFKELNDSLGHAAGDDLLRDFAAELTRSLREGDAAARLGGDEFLLVLRGAGANAEPTLRRLADRWRTSGSAMTFSAGVAVFDNGRSHHPLEEADAALYRAKRAGRNRVTVATADELMSEPETALA
jgi:diguanylate cyclase (GGDEF)-like protein